MSTRTQAHRALARSSRQLDVSLATAVLAGLVFVVVAAVAIHSQWPPRSLADPMHTRGVQ